MRMLAFTAASALALSAAACAPHVNYAARTRLDCPDNAGQLTRTSVAPDGRSCLYKAGGVDVTLQLTPVSGDATTTLNAIEAQLVGPSQAAGATSDKVQAATGHGADASAKADAASSSAAAKAAQQAAADAGSKTAHDSDWNTRDHGDHEDDEAHVNLPGLHINADNGGAKVDVAGIHIDANDDSQTVRMSHDVRLQGQAFSPEKRGVRATLIVRRDNLPDGYRFVGYEAAGPKTGPLTVALIKSHDEMDHDSRLYRDIRRLVRRNGGA